jgi:hypothetical protein
MILKLYQHYFLQLRRSSLLARDIIQAFILGIFALYAIISMIAVGVIGGELIRQYYPEQSVVSVALAALIFYFLADVLVRYFFQKYPVMQIKPYMILPVGKSVISHYLLTRSVLHFFNVLPLFAVLPFFLREVLPAGNSLESAGFLIAALCLPLLASYMGFVLNISLGVKKSWPVITLMAIIVLLYLEYTAYFSLIRVLQPLSVWLLNTGISIALFPLLLLALYRAMHSFIMRKLNVRNASATIKSSIFNSNISFFKRFGQRVAPLMQLELQIIQRLPRAKQYAITSLLIIIFPLFSLGEEISQYLILLYAFLITSMIALNHGQLMLSWNSTHFDLLLSRGIAITDIFKAKYYTLALSCALMWILSLPYAFISLDFLWFTTAMLFFNSTVSVFAYMFLASASSRRIEPEAGGLMSMDGFGLGHYLIIIPLVVLPFAVFAIGDLVGGKWLGLAFLAAVGIAGLIFHRQVIGLSVQLFNKNKYRIAASFRKE